MTPSPAAHSLSNEVAPHLCDQVVAHCWRPRRIRLSAAVAAPRPARHWPGECLSGTGSRGPDRDATMTLLLVRYRHRLLAESAVGCEQIRCDDGASARLRATLRLVQSLGALFRLQSLQLSCGKDRA